MRDQAPKSHSGDEPQVGADGTLLLTRSRVESQGKGVPAHSPGAADDDVDELTARLAALRRK